MKNANEVQVGGTHYKNTFQHWDLVHATDMGYFEGQITKYVTRNRKKNGKQDLDKAMHFLIKFIELVEKGVYRSTSGKARRMAYAPLFNRYAVANELNWFEDNLVRSAVLWQNARDLTNLAHCLKDYAENAYPGEAFLQSVEVPRDDAEEAGPGYVSQGD